MTWPKLGIGRSYIVLGVCVALSAVLLWAVYTAPLVITLDIGADDRYIPGLFAPEHNDAFTYAYTDGSASLRFPGVGHGNYSVETRIGGPLGSLPAATSFGANARQLNLGVIDQIRVYHVLIPADGYGDVAPRLESATTTLPSDVRQLGVLLDWMRVRSLGPSMPPLSVLFSTALLLALIRALLGYAGPAGWKMPVSLFGACAVVCASYARFRGELPMQGVWIAGSLVAGMVLVLWRLDT